MRIATSAWVLVLLSSACSSGGGTGAGPRDQGTQDASGLGDLGRAAAPASFLSPSLGAQGLTWPSEVVYTLDAPRPATIYYTLDGTMPEPGMPGTFSGKNPVVFDRPFGDGTISWFADYGAAFLPEAVRSIVTRVDTTKARTNLGSISSRVAFESGGGPITSVEPGTLVRGTLIYQAWRSGTGGSCPACQLQYVIFLEKGAVSTVTCVDLVNSYGVYPGKLQALDFSFTAPAAPGQYTLRAGLTLQGSCNGVVPVTYSDIGQVIVRSGKTPPV